MARFHHVATRLSIVGALALVIGSSLVAGVVTQALTSSAYADTTPYETFCPNTPAGNIVLNDVVVTGSLSPATPAVGQQFYVNGLQVQEQLPATIVQDAEATGLTSLTGTLTTTIEASGATPASISTGHVAFDVPIPNPVPADGVTLAVPSTPMNVGPFTATSADITMSQDAVENTTDIDGDNIGQIALVCSSYPNNTLPSGFTNQTPPGLPFAPVIATAGTGSPPPPTPTLTGPYELYCPHTPVGDLVLNGVTTTATISPQSLSAGEQFSVTGYQTHIPLPAGLAAAAAGLGNSAFNGLAASAVDAYGATPDRASTGSMPFDVPIPTTVPSTGLSVDFPASPATVGPFTASGGPITIAQDNSTLVVAALSSKAFKMSCTAYPNDSVATSGSTGTAPTAPPIRPVIATGSASGQPTTPTQPPPPRTTTGPYELYCPGSPVGDLVLNDTTTTATITPSTLAENQDFQLNDLQTQFSIPQNVVQQAENLGLTQITGDMSVFMDTTGVNDNEFGGTGPITVLATGGGSVASSPTTTSATTGPIVTDPILPVPLPGPFPGQFPAFFDMPFNVTLPNPVPATGVQFDAVTPVDELAGFTAAGGPISFAINSVDLYVSEFGDNFGLFCTPFPNDSEPTGLTTTAPAVSPVEPVVAAGSATITPAPLQAGPYELYCSQTPVGAFAINDVTTTGTLSPSNPGVGTQFSVTGYQSTLNVPQAIASAASALGNNTISGTAATEIDARGATPVSMPSATMDFSAPLPNPVPASGVALAVPSSPATIGPFTASGGTIAISEADQITLNLFAGTDQSPAFTVTCTAYPNDSVPVSGLTQVPPDAAPIAPVIVANGPLPPPPPTPPPGTVTGPYELYCPGTPVGNIVLNNVTTTSSIPSDLSSGQSFEATNFQTQLTLPSSIASAAQALGNSAITGDATVKVDAMGATPASLSSGPISIDAPIPSPVPAQGLELDLPSTPGTIGPFVASGGDVTLSVDPAVSLSLEVSGSTLTLTCKPFANNSEPTGIVSRGPGGKAVSPIIATSSTSTGTPPTTAPPVTTTPPVTTPTSPTTTGAGSTPTDQISQAFNTLFDSNASIPDKEAVIENGTSIATALTDAFTSSLAAQTGGVSVDAITFPDSSGCDQAGVASPCAAVTYDILSATGQALLPNNQGYAVSVNGSWLVSTSTVCALLQLFYEAQGKTGLPPGCPAPSVTPPTPTTADPTTADPTTTQGPTGPAPTSSSDSATTTGPAGVTPSTTLQVVTAPVIGSSRPGPTDPTVSADPVVQANSSSLAFTGVGAVAQWLAATGGALIIVGFVLLTMVDAPRRVLYRFTRRSSR